MAVDDQVVDARSRRSAEPVRPSGRTGLSGPVLSRESGGQVVSPAEFAAVYRVEFAALVRHVMFHGAAVDEARDAAQAAFEQALPVWPRIRAPRAWLRTVAVRAYLRSSVPETPTDAVPDQPGLSSAAARVELGDQERAVLAALLALPVKQRQVMAWSFDGFSPAEIAEALGEDPAAVRQNLHRARQNLKRELRTSELGINGKDHR